MTSAPATPWPGERPLAERYAALRHPALARVELIAASGTDAVELRPLPLPPDATAPSGLDMRTALQAVGEVALGVQALHELELTHGDIRPDRLRSVRGRWLLDGVAHPGTAAEQQADVTALGALARDLAGPAAATFPGIAAVADAATAPGATAGEVGRTALAIAGGSRPPAAPTPRPVEPQQQSPDPLVAERLAARRRSTRNRMLLVAAVVVLVGAALLKLVDTRGIVTVPREIGRAEHAAVAGIRHEGLVPVVSRTPAPAAAPGTVVGQSPAPGQRVRPGRTVTLHVAVAPQRSPAG